MPFSNEHSNYPNFEGVPLTFSSQIQFLLMHIFTHVYVKDSLAGVKTVTIVRNKKLPMLKKFALNFHFLFLFHIHFIFLTGDFSQPKMTRTKCHFDCMLRPQRCRSPWNLVPASISLSNYACNKTTMQTSKFKSSMYDINLSLTIAFVSNRFMTVCLNQISYKRTSEISF